MTKTIKLKEAARCEACGEKTYMECAYCYALLKFKGQDHNCPESEKDKDIVSPVLCDNCDE